MNLVGKVGKTDEAHEFLANHGGRGVWGRDERGVKWTGVAILREGVTRILTDLVIETCWADAGGPGSLVDGEEYTRKHKAFSQGYRIERC